MFPRVEKREAFIVVRGGTATAGRIDFKEGAAQIKCLWACAPIIWVLL